MYKTTRLTTTLFMTTLLLGSVSIGFGEQPPDQEKSLQEVKQELAEAGRAIQGYSAEQRDKAIERVGSALVTLDARIEALQDRIDTNWDQLSESTRLQTRETLTALRQRRNEVAEWYGGLKYSSSNAWDRMKEGFSDAYTALRESWVEAEQEFDKEQPDTSP
jgi:hypothetical protein